jgi:hypothetical protein
MFLVKASSVKEMKEQIACLSAILKDAHGNVLVKNIKRKEVK